MTSDVARCPFGKRRYTTQQAAENVLREMTRGRRWLKQVRGGYFPIRAYQCPRCGGWHLTSQDRDQRL